MARISCNLALGGSVVALVILSFLLGIATALLLCAFVAIYAVLWFMPTDDELFDEAHTRWLAESNLSGRTEVLKPIVKLIRRWTHKAAVRYEGIDAALHQDELGRSG